MGKVKIFEEEIDEIIKGARTAADEQLQQEINRQEHFKNDEERIGRLESTIEETLSIFTEASKVIKKNWKIAISGGNITFACSELLGYAQSQLEKKEEIEKKIDEIKEKFEGKERKLIDDIESNNNILETIRKYNEARETKGEKND